MVTTWKAKPNVLWRDGAPFTSADPVFIMRVGDGSGSAGVVRRGV